MKAWINCQCTGIRHVVCADGSIGDEQLAYAVNGVIEYGTLNFTLISADMPNSRPCILMSKTPQQANIISQ